MTTKQEVLTVLEQRRGQWISGEELAQQLNLSRSAIWKVIGELKLQGHEIESVTHKGYRMTIDSDVVSEEGIREYYPAAGQLKVFDMVDSTNTAAKSMAIQGAPHGTAVIAGQQSGGRGRRGRNFYSPQGSGIYLSMILRLDLSSMDALLVTTAASVAVCRAISEVTGKQASIKWVNDVYLEGKKICGILTEAVTDLESGGIESIVLGIGINFRQPQGGFPDDIRDIVGTLYDASSHGISRNQLAAAVLRHTMDLVSDLPEAHFMTEYRQRSNLLGRDIRLITPREEIRCRVLDIDQRGGLVVRLEDGDTKTLYSGEVTVRFAD